ncbi:peptidyl-prolyl cis-trans isomerase A (cyclophilin A) [Archangium gephyra]|uniref:Peptidyl-prolyl cis-trans isomerase n=1 Tax=Archangium gephyra TaxID=48 RepID=A0AAC8Q474_9BACT|nr:peptidylprolyl isomerase [Archangium gephyra]AKJ00798.1 Peptidyl-prolyl cis-trans isomerase [Archangium gephyra]REG25963.1 peptidyl-prolyl cis-trans isomerase A (cyclophilin A) [Archangium gephyra]
MSNRLLKTGLLLLTLTACSKDKDKQAEGTPPTGSTPPAAQTPPPATPPPATPPADTQLAVEPKVHGSSPVPRTKPPAENPGPWQQKALQGQELFATMDTNQGPIVLRLFSKEAPLTVANFVGLSTGEQTWTDPKTQQEKKGTPLYKDVIFHRVIPGFMIQGGDPLGQGTGSPGYNFEDEVQNGKSFDKVGLLAMANRGPGTNGSQFFITTSTPSHLTGRHTIFGEVVKGYDVVERISQVPTGGRDKPVKDVVVKKVTISAEQPK